MSSERKTSVEQRAYKIWEEEGRPHGRDQEHWHRAERDLAGRTDATKTPGASSVEATPETAAKAKRKAAPKSAKPAVSTAAKPARTNAAKPAKTAKAPKAKT
jgi:hypothetical protein